MTHAKCKKKRSLDKAISVWKYEGVIRQAILKLKYNFAFDIAGELANMVATSLKENFTILPRDAVLVPIPLHKKRENWRGFNQSKELGKLIAAKLGWQFAPDLLIRKEQSLPQVQLTEGERKKNIKDAFTLNSSFKSEVTSHKSLVIFDDVWTTGSTLREAGKVLKRGGFVEVNGLTIAR